LEGCVLAKADGTYKAFDRKNRLKAKRQLELTLQITDVLEGTGRNANTAGAFVMSAIINGSLTPICNLNVGSDSLRKDAWENKGEYLNKLVNVKTMQLTLGSGDKGAPRCRHARWARPGMFRTDTDIPDDMTEITEILKYRRNTGAITL
jgi:hypothetical protein